MSAPRILIVEDERITAMILRYQLQGLGYDVPPPASSGEEALRKTAELRPNLILMDVQLEGAMDGIEAAQHIRDSHGTPVVFLTAYSTADIVDRAQGARPYGYLLKPYDDCELRNAIETSLHKHRMEKDQAT